MDSPLVTVVMPTLNGAHKLGETLQTLNAQVYENIELIVVDAGSQDRTLDVVQRGYKGKMRIYTVADYDLPDMVNRGASLAEGEYVTLIHPGDSYLSQEVFSHMAAMIVEEDRPELAYSGCLLREAGREPRTLLRPYDSALLQKGKAPTSLQSCWFRVDAFRAVGKLNSAYRIRSGFDLLCRFSEREGFHGVATDRIFVDHDRGVRSPRSHILRKWETGKIIKSHYGRAAAWRWWFSQNPLTLLGWWVQERRHKRFA